MKIYAKLLVGIGIIVAAFAAAMGLLLFQTTNIISLHEFAGRTISMVQKWDNVQIRSYDMLLASGGVTILEPKWASAISAFEKSLAETKADPTLLKLGKEIQDLLVNTQNLWDLTKTQLDTAGSSLAEFKKIVVPKYATLDVNNSDGLMEAIQNLTISNQLDGVDKFYFAGFKNAIKNVTFSNDPFNNILTRLDVAVAERVAELNRTAYLTSLVSILAIIGGAFVYLHFFARTLARRIRSVEDSLRRVAQRDFTERPPELGTDEIGMLSKHLGLLVDSVGSFFGTVKVAVRNVTELKDSLSAGTAQSAAAINEINQNIEGIKNRFVILDSAIDKATAALGDIGRNLEAFKTEAETQSRAMKRAGAELGESTGAVAVVSERLGVQARSADKLKKIVLDGSERVLATNELIRSIAREIEGIAEIIELIDQISEQTNILSMNAAIESAHAGSAGKGFAVVAEEIRKLAESTQDNALRIGEALTSITGKIGSALETSETTAKAFDSVNADIVGFVGTLEEIARKAGDTSAESVQVVTAIKESVDATERFTVGTSEMYGRYRAILDAMQNIQAISDEAVNGITEIDLGSREILESVVHVNDISAQSRERVAELEAAMAGFKTADTDATIGRAAKPN